MIPAALCARDLRGGEREPLSTSAFDHDTLGPPLVNLAKFHILNFIVRLGALNYLRQLSSSPFPFPHPRMGTKRHNYIRDTTIKARCSYLSFQPYYVS